MKHLSAILLLLLCVLLAQAQNLAVQDFRLDEADVTANTHGTTVIDQNGQKCALIKMITTQTGFTFDAGSLGIVKTEQKVGEVWIYVPEGVKRLTISHPQLGQLRDYDLGQMLRRARTYVLVLKTTLPQPAVPETQTLIVNYTPTTAMVLIDSKPFTGNGHIETQLPLGSHNYIIAADGYETIEGSFKLTASAPRTITEQLVATGGQPSVSTGTNAVGQPVSIPPKIAANGTVYNVGGVQFTMVRVQGGTFQMGATSEQEKEAYSDEKPAHQVTLSDYSIGETEVTQALWKAVMGTNPSKFVGDNHPVEMVSWDECQSFIARLNNMTGLKFRLPTEAEWEYAARGGSKSRGYKYAGSDNIDEVAWYDSNSGQTTHDVKTSAANELGLYDMSGNVWEWCQDRYGSKYYKECLKQSSNIQNPQGPVSGSNRADRGGSWGNGARNCRVANRDGSTPVDRISDLGLRLVLQ